MARDSQISKDSMAPAGRAAALAVPVFLKALLTSRSYGTPLRAALAAAVFLPLMAISAETVLAGRGWGGTAGAGAALGLAALGPAVALLVLGWQLDRYSRRLEFEARHDPLTGAMNRRGLNGRLARGGGRSGVILLDLDNFKRVNDQAGHAFGDQVLRDAADAIRTVLRGGDLFARWGGEEFVVAARVPGPAELGALADRLRRTLQELPHQTPSGQVLVVTASCGCAMAASADEDMDAIVRRASGALRRAKAGGRNRTAWPEGRAAAGA